MSRNIQLTWEPPPPAASGNAVGVNPFYNSDWDFGYIFADVVKQGRTFNVANGYPTAVAVDANGWPTTDFEMVCIVRDAPNAYNPAGVYKLRAECNANPTIAFAANDPGGSCTLSNQVYSGGIVTANITLTSAAKYLWVRLTGTSGGARNFEIMRPGHVHGDVFAAEMKTALDTINCACIRPTGMLGASFDSNTAWSTRNHKPWQPSQQSGDTTPMVAYEWLIQLCNYVGCDLWINLPRNCDDDYVTKTAQAVKYGTDATGVPYTSTQANPVYPPLNSNLNCYWELANEIWNYSINDEASRATVEVNAGDAHHYNYDGINNQFYWAFRRIAYNRVRHSNLIRAVFPADMPNGTARMRPVIASQIDFLLRCQLETQYVAHEYGTGNIYGNTPHPLNYFFYGIAGAPYPYISTPNSDSLTVDQIFAQLNAYNYETLIDGFATEANTYSLHLVAYEGGPSLFATGHSEANKFAAENDPRMRTFTKDLLDYWFSKTPGVFCYFTPCNNAHFSLGYEGWGNTTTQKWQAVQDAAAGA